MTNNNNKKDKFFIKTVESSSPLSKMPSTPFRLAVLGLLEKQACYTPVDTTTVGDEDILDSDIPILPFIDGKGECDTTLEIPVGGYVAKPNEYVVLQIDHGNTKGELTDAVYTGDKPINIKVQGDTIYISSPKPGEYSIDIELYYDFCPVCVITVPLDVESIPVVPPGEGNGGAEGCMPEDPTPPDVELPTGTVKAKKRTCNTLLTESKIQEYINKETYRWKKFPGGDKDIDNNIKIIYGADKTFDNAKYWEGMDYLYLAVNFDDEEGKKYTIGYDPKYEVIEKVAPGFMDTPISEDWTTFHDTAYVNYGIESCASTVDKASLWATSKLKLVTIFDDEMEWMCESPVLETVVEKLDEIHANKLVHIIRGRDIVPDSGNAITGAFVMDWTGIKEHLGFLNIEPQLDMYEIEGTESFTPVDYKTTGSTWMDTEIVIPQDYMQFAYDVESLAETEKKALVTASVVYHELAHALENAYTDLFGTPISEEDGWLELSGWVREGDGFQQMKKMDFGLAEGDVRPPPTPYGCFAPYEDFAESYTLYKYNPKFLCYYHPKKYRYVKDIEKKLFEEMGVEFFDNGIECPDCEYTPEEPEPEEPEVGDCQSVADFVDLNDYPDLGVGDEIVSQVDIHGDKKELFEKFEQVNGFDKVKLGDETNLKLNYTVLELGSYTVKFKVHYSDGAICNLELLVNGGGDLPDTPTEPGDDEPRLGQTGVMVKFCDWYIVDPDPMPDRVPNHIMGAWSVGLGTHARILEEGEYIGVKELNHIHSIDGIIISDNARLRITYGEELVLDQVGGILFNSQNNAITDEDREKMMNALTKYNSLGLLDSYPLDEWIPFNMNGIVLMNDDICTISITDARK